MITHSMLVARQQLLASQDVQKTKAELRSVFLAQDDDMIKYILEQDLLKYMEGADISRMQLITLNKFVRKFLDKICHMYKSPPLLMHDDEAKEKQVRVRTSVPTRFKK